MIGAGYVIPYVLGNAMNNHLWKEMCDRLGRGEAVAVATIATRDGSAPRSAGAKMLVGREGILCGTLGGGPAEAMAAVEAVKALAGGESGLFSIDMGGSAATGADLICGGMVRIFVQRLEPASLAVLRLIWERMRAGLDSTVMTPVRGKPEPVLVLPGSEPDWLSEAMANGSGGACLFSHEGTEYLIEPLKARTRLILVGGGHVSLATAQMAVLVDFEVTVLDDREEFANPSRFPWLEPGRTIVTPDFRGCLREDVLGFPVGGNCCIAILTRGHSFDEEALAQALATPAGYVGMIGSRRKRDALYDRLAGRGVPRAALEKVHCPIGLPLGGDTPAEIAVSIVAELVSARVKGLA